MVSKPREVVAMVPKVPFVPNINPLSDPIVKPPNVGVEVVPILCGRDSVTDPVELDTEI